MEVHTGLLHTISIHYISAPCTLLLLLLLTLEVKNPFTTVITINVSIQMSPSLLSSQGFQTFNSEKPTLLNLFVKFFVFCQILIHFCQSAKASQADLPFIGKLWPEKRARKAEKEKRARKAEKEKRVQKAEKEKRARKTEKEKIAKNSEKSPKNWKRGAQKPKKLNCKLYILKTMNCMFCKL